MLSAEERVYRAQLPEVRVALPLPAFRPYEVISVDGAISGIHPDMLVSLGRALGLRLKPVVFNSWSESLEAAKRREVDVLMSVGVTAARAEFLEFTLGATPRVSAMFTQLGRNVPPQRARFALDRNHVSNDYVKRIFPDAHISAVDGANAAFAAIAAGQADFYVGNLLPALAQLELQPVPGIQVQQLVSYGSGHFHFAVRKDWAPLARILNQGLSQLRQEPSPELAAALAVLPAHITAAARRALRPDQLAQVIERPVWRVGAVRGLALLNDVDANGRHAGIAAEYTEAMARAWGVGLQLVPFADVGAMLDALRAGSIDVVPFLTRTPQRARDFA